MLRSKNLIGKRIISVDDGTDLGLVKDLYFDQGLSSVAGLFLGNEGLFSRKAIFVPRSAVTLFGRNVILLTQSDVVTDSHENKDVSEWVRRDWLPGRAINTAGGTKVGTIGDVLLDKEGVILGFTLSYIYLDSPVTHARVIMRDAILDVGSASSAMIVDLAKAEQQSLKQL